MILPRERLKNLCKWFVGLWYVFRSALGPKEERRHPQHEAKIRIPAGVVHDPSAHIVS